MGKGGENCQNISKLLLLLHEINKVTLNLIELHETSCAAIEFGRFLENTAKEQQ